jgi:UTP--glucose-1-phosphate uridylyltransferase
MRKAIWRYDIVCHVLASLREFSGLFSQETGAGGEIQITDAMIGLLKTQDFRALKYGGRTFDCGSKQGFLLANVAYALNRGDLAPAFAAELKRLL